MARLLGPYRLEARIGAGGMGEVFRAVDPRLQRTVAIKLLQGDAAGRGDARRRFEREARAVAALSHPAICVVYDFDVDEVEDQPYLVMEYLEGETLQKRLERGPLPFADIVAIGAALADALDTTHAVGIVHRDIKPANIFLTTRNQPKLMDFGIAKPAAGDVDPGEPTVTSAGLLTAPGAAIGTLAYMSPEQARGEPADARSDIFSLGVTLYEMTAGRRPFDGATGPLICDAILNREPPPIRPLRPDLPPALGSVIADALVKDREHRLPTAGAMRDRLQATGPSPAHEAPAAPFAMTHRQAPRRGRRAVVMTLALAATVAAGFGVWRVGRGAAAAGVRSVAVLPFDDSAAAGAREQLQGLAGTVADTLARHTELTVMAGARTAPFSATGDSPEAVARALGDDAALQTRIAQSGDRLQVDAALIGAGGERLWSARYQPRPRELSTLERTLVGELVQTLNLTPAPAATAPSGSERAVDPRAYDLYLRSRYHTARWNEAELDLAIGMLEQATAIDATFGPAHAMLGLFYGVKAFNYRPDDPELRAKGHAAVEKALVLNPDLAEAHYARGILIWQPSEAWPHRAALQAFDRALAIQPNLDDAWHHRGVVLMHIGHLDRAATSFERALALNPVNTQAQFRFAPLRNYQHRYDDALTVLRRVPRDVYPSQWSYHMGWTLVTQGRLTAAAQEIESALAGNRADQGGVIHATRALLRATLGDRRGAAADVATAQKLGQGYGHFHHTALTIGEVYAVLGDLDRAQAWVEKAGNDGFPCYTFFENDPHLAPLRETERFRRYLAQVRAEVEPIGAGFDVPPPQGR